MLPPALLCTLPAVKNAAEYLAAGTGCTPVKAVATHGRETKEPDMTGLLRMRKVASGLLLVGVLMMMTAVATTAASSGHSKAKFSAAAPVMMVGPGEGASGQPTR